MSLSASDDKFFSKHDSAVYLSLSVRTIEKAIAKGELRCFRFGRKVLLRRSDLDRFIERRSS